jgi:hypothetical protein
VRELSFPRRVYAMKVVSIARIEAKQLYSAVINEMAIL